MTESKKSEFVSIVVPVYEEEWCIWPIMGKIKKTMDSSLRSWEVIFINDGSSDGSRGKLDEIASRNENAYVLHLRRNFGVTQALQAGINASRGDYIVTISGNLQNDPADIPILLEELDRGCDVCAGWQASIDGPIARSKPKRWVSWVISKISGVKLHDYDCTLRAYRATILGGMRLHGDLARYIPVYASWRGGRIKEVEVRQLPRSHGHPRKEQPTKRAVKTILDLILLKFMERYSDRPFYVFGSMASLLFVLAVLSFAYMLFGKIFNQISFIETPLPLVTTLFFLTSVILFSLGIIADLLTRVYIATLGRNLYEVE
jgi:glycosyltransferase involved in cell wall biosynthesis